MKYKKKDITNKNCPKCSSKLYNEIIKEIDYPYVCLNCDENFYNFEITENIEKTQKEYPIENTFCYECGNHTHDASYNEQMEENFLLSEIRNLTTESEE